MIDDTRLTDWQSRVVIFKAERWHDVILVQHPELIGREDLVRRAVEFPAFVGIAPDEPSKLYYYVDEGIPEITRSWLRVEVKYLAERVAETELGILIDAKFVDEPFPREGEVLAWTPLP